MRHAYCVTPQSGLCVLRSTRCKPHVSDLKPQASQGLWTTKNPKR